MAATERVTILMEPAQKAALVKEASAEGLSVGELIRNKALDQDRLLAALAHELRESTANALRTIDATIARMDAREQRMAEREAAVRRAAEAEFAGLDAEAFARWLAAAKPDNRA